MSNYKRGLIVAIAILTVVGMTAVFAAPTGAANTAGDGLTSTFDSFSDASADSGNNDSDDHPACDNPGNSDNNSANCTDKDEDDEDDEDDEEDEDDENEEEDDNEEDEENEGGEDAGGTCETGGAAQNNTFANEAFGTENESGPVSSQFHANEEQFQDAEPIAHEVSCGVATIDNNAAGNDSDDGGDGGDGNESNPAQDLIDELEDNAPGNESDDGDDGDDGEMGSCETGGAAQNNTIANEAFGTENESGPVSSQIHANEEQFQDGEPLAHEASCGVATVDNNAS